MKEGYIIFDGKPIVLTMANRKGWRFCEDGDSPSVVSREWYEKYIHGEGVEFVPIH